MVLFLVFMVKWKVNVLGIVRNDVKLDVVIWMWFWIDLLFIVFFGKGDIWFSVLVFIYNVFMLIGEFIYLCKLNIV